MARLSGMPSEHHHEGPGDAPRRKRGRPQKNQSSSQASQEVASSSKRPASPTAEPTHIKRTKRVQVTDEDQILEEIEQSTTRSQQGDTIHVETHSSSQAVRRANRRHSEPPVTAQDDEEEDELFALTPHASTQPAPGLTPHLNRIGAVRRDLGNARRARMSMPAQLERVDEELSGTQFQYAPLTAVLDGRTRRRLRRSHLSQEVIDIEDNQKKDKKMLLELRKQLREQDDKIKNLEYDLEARRLGEIDMTDDRAEELEQELELAREQIDRLRASSLYNGSDRDLSTFDGAADMSDDEDGQLLLVDPEELRFNCDMEYEFIPDGEYATRVQELASQMTFESLPEISQLTHDTLLDADGDVTILQETIQEKAVERYERELQHYIRRLGESQGALRIIAIELQNLNYLDPGHTSNEVLIELRHGFDTLRTEVEKYFPGTTEDLTNQQLLQKIPELFSGIFFELREKISISSSSQKTEILLRRQYEGVLDLLAESEDRIKELEQKEYSLDKGNEDKQRTIVDLEEQVTTLTTLANDQDNDLNSRDADIAGLRQDVEEKDTGLERLREAIEGYRRELETMTKTSTEFEATHYETIARMEEEHADVMQGVQNELAAEQEAREAAENDAIQKGEVIDELEGRIESMESEVVVITDELAELRERLVQQTEGRETAEGQRDEQAELADEYANTIETLEQTIAELREQLEDAKINLDAERAQREKTEADLDDANEKLEAAHDRLHNMGIQANELRSKLFELQQSKEAAVKQLGKDAEARENDLTEQLNSEIDQRETAETTIIDLNKEIEALQADLAAAQNDYDNMSDARQQLEEDRESQAAALNQQLADLRAKYTALENSTNSTITSLQANITDLNNQVQQQQAEINRLRDEVADKDERYDIDTTALIQKVEDLRGELATERGENERNRKEIFSLSDRVENEANELLNMMNAHSEEVTALKSVIATHELTIANLQATAEDREAEHEDLIIQRTTEIEEMRITSTARLETIVLLEASLEKLKAQFAAQEQDTRQTIDALNLAHRRLIEENEKLADAAKARFVKTLQHVQNMKVERVELKTQGVEMSQVAQPGRVVKTSEKVKVSKKGGKKKVATRGWRDSGMFDSEDTTSGAGKVDGEMEEMEFAA